MGFYVWTCLGLAIGIVHLFIPGQHRVGPASAIALGVAGAWGGALFASAFIRGGWSMFGPLAIAGAILGAVGAVASIEILADRHVAAEARDRLAGGAPDRRARLHP